ncbi:lipocalin family protein [Anaerovorax odorimutans]|uniref:Lipocalin family protein n=1 Tax=Anaerovorax odorimutans TaxID=109327 RepID=A0ABT1RKZ6_9FIRM|nr:lipocalin family protein [Anaerovorax odorimutans]MCQ4635856.1 lipocalin family protein [Anaerovorax odorimutans]
MKQARKILSVISVAILLCIAFTACGDSSDDPVVGTWEMTSVSAMGQEMSAADFLKAANYTETPVITFNGDNTVDVDMLGNKGSGKWELKDGKYHVTDNSDVSLEFTLEDNKLSTEQSGGKLVFEKKQ